MSQLKVELPEALGFLFDKSRYKVAYGGRGSSKSWSFARALIIKAAQKPTRILCARETQHSIQESVHKLLSDQIDAMGLSELYEVQQTRILGKNGSEFTFAGIRQQSIANLKSFEGVDICWVEEAQVVTKRSWDVLIPTIRKPGSEIWITLNPDLDTDETYKRFIADPPDDAIVRKVNYVDNPWFPPELEKERQLLKRRDPTEYETVWEGNCRPAVEGAIYFKEIEKMQADRRICNVPYDPLLKVHTFWDLGWNDAMTIIMVQRQASEIRIIDYIEDSHLTYVDYVSMLDQRRYNWGKDYLPHDARAKSAQTGKSALEVLQNLKRRCEVVPILHIEEGIKAARLIFPRLYIDKTKCARLVECLKRYRRAVSTTTNEPGNPLHDEYSHGADAFRGLGIMVDKLSNDNMTATAIKYPDMGIV